VALAAQGAAATQHCANPLWARRADPGARASCFTPSRVSATPPAIHALTWPLGRRAPAPRAVLQVQRPLLRLACATFDGNRRGDPGRRRAAAIRPATARCCRCHSPSAPRPKTIPATTPYLTVAPNNHRALGATRLATTAGLRAGADLGRQPATQERPQTARSPLERLRVPVRRSRWSAGSRFKRESAPADLAQLPAGTITDPRRRVGGFRRNRGCHRGIRPRDHRRYGRPHTLGRRPRQNRCGSCCRSCPTGVGLVGARGQPMVSDRAAVPAAEREAIGRAWHCGCVRRSNGFTRSATIAPRS